MQFNLFSHFSWNKVLEKQSHKVPKMVKKEERKKKKKNIITHIKCPLYCFLQLHAIVMIVSPIERGPSQHFALI